MEQEDKEFNRKSWERLEDIVSRLGITWQELAKEAGVTYSAISKARQRNSRISFPIRHVLQANHNVRMEYLFDGEGEPFDHGHVGSHIKEWLLGKLKDKEVPPSDIVEILHSESKKSMDRLIEDVYGIKPETFRKRWEADEPDEIAEPSAPYGTREAIPQGIITREMPLLELPAIGGIFEYSDDLLKTNMYAFQLPDQPQTRTLSIAFVVVGDSMSPRVEEGTTLFCRPVEDVRLIGSNRKDIYVIHYRDSVVSVKYIHNDPQARTLRLVSENSRLYDDVIVPYSEINHIWLAAWHSGPL